MIKEILNRLEACYFSFKSLKLSTAHQLVQVSHLDWKIQARYKNN